MSNTGLTLPAGPIGLIAHVGAGLCEALDDYLSQNPADLLLIEPNPEYAEDLRRRTAALEAASTKAEVLEQAVTAEAGRAPFHLLNFADLSCLKDPEGLRTLMPGIRVVAKPMVDIAPLSQILKGRAIEKERFNALVIEALGEEITVLEDLRASGLLQTFDQIAVRVGAAALLEGAGNVKTVQAFLSEQGFRLDATDSASDPDWPLCRFSLDRLSLENKSLKDDISKRKAEAAKLQEALSAAQARAEALEQEKAALSPGLTELKGEAAKLREDLSAAQARAEALEQEKAALSSGLTELKGEAAKLREDLSAAQARAEALEQEKEQLEPLRLASDEALAKARDGETSALADLRMAVKMQSLVRADLEDLQQRYRTLKGEKTALEDLLGQLTRKLETAATHLRDMSDSGFDQLSGSPESEDIAPAKTPVRKKAAGKKTVAKKSSPSSRSHTTTANKKKRGTS
ncbi:hypothetical protein [Neptunicoccus sediminis]|uniref:hypothetical protein n=1 Tax=Neptunicoccus sediminis TaxID=1892596 RepID=UPI000845D96E|nr:hypothetical protein [Neptunicoccus sediminis]